ncbi:MAG: hypothetical protein AMJ55_08255 [Gammaproteobacteria bacterium SG8_15]|nr:MAG: hypothetical protein AMJ55_08255 [Gammaproteobacteria bacterium SG8_15]
MAQICLSNQTCIDIYETDGLYAYISVFKNKRIIGPEYDLANLTREVIEYLDSLRGIAKYKEMQQLELQGITELFIELYA